MWLLHSGMALGLVLEHRTSSLSSWEYLRVCGSLSSKSTCVSVDLNKLFDWVPQGIMWRGGFDRRIGAASAIMWMLYWYVILKRELSIKTKLSKYQSVYVPIVTYGRALGSDGKNEFADTSSRNEFQLQNSTNISHGSLLGEAFWAYLTERRPQTQDWRDYISHLAWEHIVIPAGWDGWGEESVGFSAQTSTPMI